MQALKAGVLYFALAFAAGFMLGIVRTLWAVPRVGVRVAELMEAPIMLVDPSPSSRAGCVVCATGDGKHRTPPHARCGIRIRVMD